MVTIAVTGIGGLVGGELLARLEERDDVERIVGLDLHPPVGVTSSKLDFRHADIRDAGLSRIFEGVDVLVHLAFQLDPIQDERTMRDINVGGTQNVFEAARDAGVHQIVYPSSAVVYGAHPDNDFPLTEESPLRANPDFNYGEHKAEIEHWLWPWIEQRDAPMVTVLRPAIIVGPGIQNFISRLFEMPMPLTVRGHRPPLQFVHVDDVVSAIDLAVDNDEMAGAFNVAAEGWLSWDEVLAIVGKRAVEVPEEVAFASVDRLWRLGLGDVPPGIVHYFMHPWVVSPAKLIEHGWRPKHTNRDVCAVLGEQTEEWVTVGRTRVHRSRLRRIARGILGGLVAVVGLRLLRRLRRS